MEVKLGRICMLAAVSFAVPSVIECLPDYLVPSMLLPADGESTEAGGDQSSAHAVVEDSLRTRLNA